MSQQKYSQLELELEIIQMYDEILIVHNQLRVIDADAFPNRAEFHNFTSHATRRVKKLMETIKLLTEK